MASIVALGHYLPADRVTTSSVATQFEMKEGFLEGKIGFRNLARMSADESVHELCLRAIEDLKTKVDVDPETLAAIILVTQNPDQRIPHGSARIHGELRASSRCATFDVSLGCSGFVSALQISAGFVERDPSRQVLLLTCDPYSRVVSMQDRDTAMIFGDAASATLVGQTGRWRIGPIVSGTDGQMSKKLESSSGSLAMRGNAVLSFVMKHVPGSIQEVCSDAGTTMESIDEFIVHQGSKYIVDCLCRELGVPAEKIPFEAGDYGNTVSSSIPIMLSRRQGDSGPQANVISGFGVGLCYSTGLLFRS